MAGNSTFLRSEATLAWLGQFDPSDQPHAADLLRAMTLVSRDAFAERLKGLIVSRFEAAEGPVGLYVERELPHRNGVPHRLFKETKTKVRRASGVGPQPVKPTRAYDKDVGSEGIVAQLVSEVCRERPKQFLNHPGPDAIRKSRVRRFILVTDFIGSGMRARNYIEAAWRVRSVRSWWSAKGRCGMAFEVIAYAAADIGRTNVERHNARPTVHIVAACPTIENSFGEKQRWTLRDLCRRYCPTGTGLTPLGFGSVGALIAFAHGVPNNSPLILHKKSSSWMPLFPARVTARSRLTFTSDAESIDTVRAQLIAMRQKRLSEARGLETIAKNSRRILFVLAATARPPRHVESIAVKTGLTLAEVETELARALSFGWIDGRNRLTDRGHAELSHARRPGAETVALPSDSIHYYCPTQLRMPRESLS